MNKRTITLLAVFAIACFLFQLLATVPARLVLGHAGQVLPQVSVAGVQGTIWSGSAANIELSIDGKQHSLGETKWQLSKLPLIWGSAALDLSAQHNKQTIIAHAALGVGGSVRLSDSDISLPAAMIREFAPIPVEIGGQLSLRINELELVGQAVEALDGVLTWQQAEVDFTGTPAELGSYVAELSMDDKGAYLAKVSDLGGAALGISGDVEYAPQQRTYKVDAQLIPGEKLDPNIKNMIFQFGTPDARGAIRFKQSGQI
jgi:hypothetical protein